MNRATRHHVDRRSSALDRLESITAGAAIAGVAGTIGFGALAALTFSGTTTAAAEPAAPAQPDVTIDRSGSDDELTPGQPNNNDDGSQFFQVVPAPRSAAGRGGHAASGGSG
jgi:hypothetical protein